MKSFQSNLPEICSILTWAHYLRQRFTRGLRGKVPENLWCNICTFAQICALTYSTSGKVSGLHWLSESSHAKKKKGQNHRGREERGGRGVMGRRFVSC